MSKFHRRIFKRIMKKSKPIIKATIRSGAENIGKRLEFAVSDTNQPNDILLKNIVAAVKSGALATGIEMLQRGFDHKKAK